MLKINKTKDLVIITAVLASLSSTMVFADKLQDTKITTIVKATLAKEPDIQSLNVQVSTNDNIVRLSGIVDTHLQLHRVVELAHSVDGVKKVDDRNLKAKSSNDYLRDALTTARVKGTILQLSNQNKIGKNHELHVETINGQVHIHGKVVSLNDTDTIKRNVSNLEHVRNVDFNVHS